ncbi:MAG: lipopolysaccharide biosynthesis protein [Bryobacterales bacterium]|nr:lipopolysaccharide biosynthesis protein [Bryobacterales bacterium]
MEGRNLQSVASAQVPQANASLRGDFAWTFTGNAVYAAGQWAVLSLFAKLGGAEMLGEYALALAVTAPVGMLAHLNLRSVLATDTAKMHAFGDYLAVRLPVTAAALTLIVFLAPMVSDGWVLAGAIVAAGLGQSAETVSDLCYGAMQRRDRMRQVAWSMIGRTIVSVGALGAALWITGNLLWAVGALAAGRLTVLLLYDLPAGVAGETLARSGFPEARRIFETALPLGLVLMLVSLNTNLPRYAIEHRLGSAELGVFAAVVSFITVGSTMANAMGQSATARLARHFQEGRFAEFRRLTFGMASMMLALGVAGIAVAMFAGRWVLELLYRPEFAAYQPLLVAAMGAGTLSYLAIALGYSVTSARIFRAQLPLFALSAAVCGVASWLLVPGMGLYGAISALALAGLMLIAGQWWILRAALRDGGRPR